MAAGPTPVIGIKKYFFFHYIVQNLRVKLQSNVLDNAQYSRRQNQGFFPLNTYVYRGETPIRPSTCWFQNQLDGLAP